ncbi:hypothetical protein JEP09_04835 [Proteus mirabilis]|uniref:hypothetical protein n=1 Tax=Proteus mirabilis TaxID=584 RepID=UPI001A2C1754|nr:hypothetical protein [Proteus mirabilis]EKV7295179.1 hypothetical protein [Proteus mirabilis]ELT1805360.1 hypothetical protein [Proteus mirabilis]MBI6443664.1 hypothetical protein [Proteus mirabilis]MBT0657732.1 hypothetical protein [Proteus mirabilis]MDU6046605.1 hypothetical protein [Proteus mirabilis]
MRKLLLICFSIIALSGCVSPMTKQDVANATYSELPANYKDEITEVIKYSLKDPDSAKFIFHEPRLAYTAASKNVAYVVPIDVNAKNSYGGYVGYKTMYYAYTNERYQDVTTGIKYTAVKWVDEITE